MGKSIDLYPGFYRETTAGNNDNQNIDNVGSLLCRQAVLQIRRHILGSIGYCVSDIYLTTLSSFQSMKKDDFMKFALKKIEISTENDWEKSPQYYMALTDLFISYYNEEDNLAINRSDIGRMEVVKSA